jgi:uncharacterized coiled-coil protein SlyX
MIDDQTEQKYSPTFLLSERTAIKLQLGFIAAIVSGIIAAVLFLASMRADVISMITRVAVQETIIQDLQRQIVENKIHSQSVDDNLMFFRQAIEEDQRWHRTHVDGGFKDLR